MLQKVIITYTITSDLDEAFILFNSQNTRGKPLDDKDLLKGHHIRFIARKHIQKECAMKFEKTLREKINNKDIFSIILGLLTIIKSASRGDLQGYELSKPNIYENFKSEFVNDDIVFNKYHSYFTVTSSIQGGIAFFEYLKKYTELYHELSKDDSFTCYDGIWGSGNTYLSKIYKAIILFYRDKFTDYGYGVEKALQILLLNFRLDSDSVRPEGVAKDMQKWFVEIMLTSNKEVFKNKLKTYIRNNINDLKFEYRKVEIGNKEPENKLHYLKNNKFVELKDTKLDFYNATYFKDEIRREYENGNR